MLPATKQAVVNMMYLFVPQLYGPRVTFFSVALVALVALVMDRATRVVHVFELSFFSGFLDLVDGLSDWDLFLLERFSSDDEISTFSVDFFAIRLGRRISSLLFEIVIPDFLLFGPILVSKLNREKILEKPLLKH